MRIGLDFAAAVSHPPGAGRYARELVRALVRLEDRPELALLEFGRERACYDTPALGIAFGDPRTRRVRVPWPRRALDWSAKLGRAADDWLGGVDVFHHTRALVVPVSRAVQTIAIAELPAEAALPPGTHSTPFTRAWSAARAAIVFSESARTRVAERLGIPPAGIHAVPVGCEHWRRDLAELPPPARPARVLVLGRLTPERAPHALLAACEELAQRGADLELVIAGAPPDANESGAPELVEFRARLARSPLRERVLWPLAGLAPIERERALPRLVASSGVLVHLVADALTPVTPLEALALGVPVVAPQLPAFTEALGSELFATDLAECRREPRVLADALEAALRSRTDASACDRRVQCARPFSWEANARATLAVWQQVARAS